MKVSRKFLGWTKPFLPAVAEELLAEHRPGSPFPNAIDLRHLVVVCPLNRAKRRLLDLLAIAAGESKKVLIPPRLITVGDIPETLFQDLESGLAHESLECVVLEAAVSELPLAMRQVLLGREVDQRSLRAFAEKVIALRNELAGANLNFDGVWQHQKKQGRDYDLERWQALGKLEQCYLASIKRLNLIDRNSARQALLEARVANPSAAEVFLVGCADLNRLQRTFLEKAEVKLTGLIFAPESIKERFDEIGCLVSAAWADLPSALSEDLLKVCASEQEEVEQVLRILKEHEKEIAPSELTIGLGNESLGGMLKETLSNRGVVTRLATAPTLAQSPPGELLILLNNYFTSKTYVDFRSLLGHADFIKAISDHLNLKATEILSSLDEFYQSHLPEQFELTELSRLETNSEIGALLTAKLNPLFNPAISADAWRLVLVSLIDFVFGQAAATIDETSNSARHETLTELARLIDLLEPAWKMAQGAAALTERWALLVRGLESATLSHPQEPSSVEALGWLELQTDDAPNIIVTGFNEGYVPESINADQFLPNTLRTELGLLDNQGRFARDLFALESIIASRKVLAITLSQFSVAGEPLLPSRLALQVKVTELPRRLRVLVGSEKAESTLSASSDLVGPALARPDKKNQVERVSVSGLNAYLSCPFRFYLQHVLKLRSVDDEARELAAPDIGSLAHEVLRRFGVSEIRDSSDLKAIEQFLLSELLIIERDRFGDGTHPAVKVQIEFLRARFRAFADWQAAWVNSGWKILHVETPVTEQGLAIGETGLRLTGRIDRIDHHPQSGRYAVFDYKVREKNKTVEKSHRVKGAWKNLQLPAYRWMLMQSGLLLVSDWSQVRFGFLTLAAATEGELVDWSRWSDGDFAQAEGALMKAAADIRTGIFWPPTEIPAAWEDPLRWVVAEYEERVSA